MAYILGQRSIVCSFEYWIAPRTPGPIPADHGLSNDKLILMNQLSNLSKPINFFTVHHLSAVPDDLILNYLTKVTSLSTFSYPFPFSPTPKYPEVP